MGVGDEVRVLHINDCAFTTTNLMGVATRRHLPWRYRPLAVTDPGWVGTQRWVRRGARGVAWLAGLALDATRADLMHVHFATVTRHTSWVPRPVVLHLHGTDARSYQYDRQLGPLVRRAIDTADAVLYSTPDLAEHVRRRPDAQLLPVPIDTEALPAWAPAERPRVFFASRWEPVKGLEVQLATARAIQHRAPEAELVGIRWGSGAEQASAAGVRLLPRLPHSAFLAELAQAHVVVGQPTGMLAASELEAVGMGVPVVAPVRAGWYSESGAAVPPVLGGVDIVRAHALPPQDPATSADPALTVAQSEALGGRLASHVASALSDPEAVSTELAGAAWVAAEHSSARGVDRLLQLYAAIMAGRRR